MLAEAESQPLARNYPQKFAEAVADIFHDLRSTARGCPPLPGSIPSALVQFQQHTTDPEVGELFEFADLDSVYVYLRGGTSLRIPPEWRPLFPVMEVKVREDSEEPSEKV